MEKMFLGSLFIINCFIISCLVKGTASLRLLKVEIPAYKFRGESALLECLYELSGSSSSGKAGAANHGELSHYHTHHHRSRLRRQTRQNDHRHQLEEDEEGADFKYAKRKRKKLERYYRHFEEDDEDEEDTSQEGLGDEQEDDLDNNKGSYVEESLYSVKWYKDNEEFYRFVPKANPPQNSYKVEGIRVDHKHSDSSRVMLRGITIKSTGHYRCEISAEAPNFASIQGEGHMEVVYLPKDGPHISGEERTYTPGDVLSLNCSSGKSHPASTLHWFINGVQVTDHSFIMRYPRLIHMYGLITSRLGLSLPLESSSFHNGKAVVKCASTISPGFWGGGRKESLAQATRHHSVIDSREDTFIVHSSASAITISTSLAFLLLLSSVTLL